MALSASTIWEVRTGGSDTQCGGGFNAARGGVDYTLQTAAQATGTATVSGTTLTATTGIFTSAMVGNCVTDGTSWREITAFTSSTVVAIDATVVWTGATIYVGGALASIGQAAAIRVLGNTIYLKYNATPYTISSTTANIATGVVNVITGSDSVADYFIGYDTTRTIKNLDANLPTLQVAASGVTSVSIFKVTGSGTVANCAVRNITIDGQSKTAIRGFEHSAGAGALSAEWCQANNCTNSGFSNTGNSGAMSCKFCYATGCSTQPAFSFNHGLVFACVAKANTIAGFMGGGTNHIGATFLFCVSDSNSGALTDGFQNSSGSTICRFVGCTSHNNGRDGFRFASSNARGTESINCIAYGNGGWGFNNSGTSPYQQYFCAGGLSPSGNENNVTQSYSFVTLSADPFVARASGNFALNNTAGGGAACRAAGFPGVFPGGLTTGYQDIGAVQHQDAGGGAPSITSLILQSIGTY